MSKKYVDNISDIVCLNCNKKITNIEHNYKCDECGYDFRIESQFTSKSVEVDGETYTKTVRQYRLIYSRTCQNCKHQLKRNEYLCPKCNEFNLCNNEYIFKHNNIEHEISFYACDGDYEYGDNVYLDRFLIIENSEYDQYSLIQKIVKLIENNKLIIREYGIIIKEPYDTIDVFNDDYICRNYNKSKSIPIEMNDDGKLIKPCPFFKEPLKRYKDPIESAIKVGSSLCRECEFYDSGNKKEIKCNYRRV